MSARTPTSQELTALLESGDLHGLMLAVVRAWADRYHPEAQYVNVVAHLGREVPDAQVPVTLRASASASPLPAPS